MYREMAKVAAAADLGKNIHNRTFPYHRGQSRTVTVYRLFNVILDRTPSIGIAE